MICLLPPPMKPCGDALEAHCTRLGEAWQALKASILPRNSHDLLALTGLRSHRRHIALFESMLLMARYPVNPVDVDLADVAVWHAIACANKHNICGGMMCFLKDWDAKRDTVIDSLDWQATQTWARRGIYGSPNGNAGGNPGKARINDLLRQHADMCLERLGHHILLVEHIV